MVGFTLLYTDTNDTLVFDTTFVGKLSLSYTKSGPHDVSVGFIEFGVPEVELVQVCAAFDLTGACLHPLHTDYV